MKGDKRTASELDLQRPAPRVPLDKTKSSRESLSINLAANMSIPIAITGLLEEYLRQNPAVCFIKDDAGRYLFVNEAFEQAFGVHSTSVLGKTDDDWLGSEAATPLMRNDAEILSQSQAKESIERLTLADGNEREWLVWKYPCSDSEGNPLIGGIAFDFTKTYQSERHLRGQAELLELILNNIGDPVIAVDENGKLLLFNPAAIRLYGMGILGTSQTKSSDRYGLFLPDGTTPYPKVDLPLARAIRGESVTDLEIFVRTPDAPHGTYLSAKAQPILDTDGRLKGGAAVFRDITLRKRAEEQLQLTVNQLKEARDEAIQASELKSQFVSNISHELRTPMSGVLGMTELLMGMTLEPEQHELATYIYESAQSLLSVLNELLDFSRLEAGKLALEQTAFVAQEAVDEVAASVQLAMGRKGLEMKTYVHKDVPTGLRGDLRRIKQVLQHMLQNAVKFTEAGSVCIDVSLDRRVDNVAFIRFSVIDSGIGIAEEVREHIFSPFVQADGSSTRKYGGVGLGLSISKRLVKLMSGSLGVESEQGKGSTFWFTIPLECTEEPCNKKSKK
jgi:PAS domain S-box-containing protein